MFSGPFGNMHNILLWCRNNNEINTLPYLTNRMISLKKKLTCATKMY